MQPSTIQHDSATDALARQGALAQDDHPLRHMGARQAHDVLKVNQVEGISTIPESDEPPESPQPPLPAPEAEAPITDPLPDQLPEPNAVADVCRLVV